MAVEYRIDVKNTSGARVAVVTDMLWLAYRKEVNAPGVVRFAIGESHPLLDLIGDKYQVEVWRRDLSAGLDWYADFYALFRDDETEAGEDGHGHVTLTCPGMLSMLGWRINAYPAGTANKTAWSAVAAETIMKTIVTFNCTAFATTGNGRDRAGQITGVSVQTTSGAGNTLSWERARSNVLKELQDLALIAGGDFDLVPTGASTWEFRWYTGQRGTDRSGDVIFAQEYGNMRQPRLTRVRSGEATVAIVGGQGEESARTITTRTGTNYSATNDIETFVDARQAATVAAMQAAGDRTLDAARARAQLDWQVVQTASSRYGRDYEVGDLVTGRYRGVEATKKIRAATIEYRDGRETVQIETSDP